MAACQPSENDASGPAPISRVTEDLVGEWSSGRRGDTGGETLIFARDRGVVLRDGNQILRSSAPVSQGGRLTYEVDESEEPDLLDFVVENGVGEQVARVPGIVKVLTDDQVQVCMDPETLTRPADFTGGDGGSWLSREAGADVRPRSPPKVDRAKGATPRDGAAR